MFSQASRRILTVAVLVTGALVAPGAGSAMAGPSVDVEASARLAAQANVDTTTAAKAVRRSQKLAMRYIKSSRKKLQQSYRITAEANGNVQGGAQGSAGDVQAAGQASATFVAAVDANSRRLESIVRKSGSRVKKSVRKRYERFSCSAGKALSQNIEMRADVVASFAASVGRVESSSQGEGSARVGELATGQATAFAQLVVMASSKKIERRVRRLLQQAIATSLEARAKVSASLVELHARVDAEAKARYAQVLSFVAEQAERMRKEIEGSGQANASVYVSGIGRTTLGELSARVSASSRASASVVGHGPTQVNAQAQAEGEGSLYVGVPGR